MSFCICLYSWCDRTVKCCSVGKRNVFSRKLFSLLYILIQSETNGKVNCVAKQVGCCSLLQLRLKRWVFFILTSFVMQLKLLLFFFGINIWSAFSLHKLFVISALVILAYRPGRWHKQLYATARLHHCHIGWLLEDDSPWACSVVLARGVLDQDGWREPVSSYRSHASWSFCVLQVRWSCSFPTCCNTTHLYISALHSATQNAANCRYVKCLLWAFFAVLSNLILLQHLTYTLIPRLIWHSEQTWANRLKFCLMQAFCTNVHNQWIKNLTHIWGDFQFPPSFQLYFDQFSVGLNAGQKR